MDSEREPNAGRPWRGYLEWARMLEILACVTWMAGGIMAFLSFVSRVRYDFFASLVAMLLAGVQVAALGGCVWGVSKLLLMVGQGFWHEPADENR